MKNTPESEWLIQGLGAAVLVLGTCGAVAVVAWAAAFWNLP